MKASRMRDGLAIVGVLGIGASVWLKDWQLAPGIVGGICLAAALVSQYIATRGGRTH